MQGVPCCPEISSGKAGWRPIFAADGSLVLLSATLAADATSPGSMVAIIGCSITRFKSGNSCVMRPLRYSINVTLDGCCDHRVMIPDEDLHRNAVENLAQADALLLGRVTYEMMEAGWRSPARVRLGGGGDAV